MSDLDLLCDSVASSDLTKLLVLLMQDYNGVVFLLHLRFLQIAADVEQAGRKDAKQWWEFSYKEWEKATLLERRFIKNGIKRLSEFGWLQTKKEQHPNRTVTCYCFDTAAFDASLALRGCLV